MIPRGIRGVRDKKNIISNNSRKPGGFMAPYNPPIST
jgi:hypothetical protein